MDKKEWAELAGKRILIQSNGWNIREAFIRELSPSGLRARVSFISEGDVTNESEWIPIYNWKFLEILG